MRRALIVSVVFLLIAASITWLYRKRSKPVPVVPRNVLLITVDTLRADHLGSYGYAAAQTPNMDQWASKGTLFENATTTVPLTLPAHSSMMTGQNPYVHGVRDNGGFYLDEKAVTLAETLKEAGFHTGGFVSAFVLDRRWGISQGFDYYFDNFELSKYKMLSLDSVQRRGDETLEEGLKWMDQNKDSRFFAWIHFYDPHTPYEPPEPFRSAALTKGGIGLYDGEISFVDNLIGRINDFLVKRNLLSTTIVVLVADHGESLGQHQESGHGFFVYDATVHVPLIILMPGETPRRIPDQVRTIDIRATILDAVGDTTASKGQGVSLLPLVRGESLEKPLVAYSESYYPRFHYGWSELKAIRTNEYKYIQAPEQEFYRMPEDPHEKDNLFQSEQKRAALFERELVQMIGEHGEIQQPQAIDDDSLEKLQALGYIGTAVPTTIMEDGNIADPKDKIRLYNRVKMAQSFSAEGKTEDAYRSIRQVLAEDKQILEAHLVLGNLLLKDKEYAEARKSFQAALNLNPDYVSAIFAMARSYKEEENWDAARAGFERLMQMDPRDSKPYFHLADIALEQKDLPKALSLLQKVVEMEPDQAISRNRLGGVFLEMNQLDQADQEFQEALTLNPRIPNAHFNRALVFENRQQWQPAIEEYRTELDLFPESYPAHFNLSRIFRKLGQPDRERAELEECVRQNPDYGLAYLYLAYNLLRTGGDLQKAKSLAETGLPLVKETSQIPFGHYVIADIYNRIGMPGEAMAHVQQAKKLEAMASN